MRIVLDTNVFLVSLSPFSQHAPIFNALLAGRFTLLRHFKVLEQTDFPFVKTAKAEEFLEMLTSL